MDRIAVDGDTFLKSLHFYCGNVRVLVFAEKKGKEKKMGVSFALRLRLFTRRWFDRTRAPRQSKKKKKKGLTFAFSGMHQCSLLTLSVCKTCFNVSKKKMLEFAALLSSSAMTTAFDACRRLWQPLLLHAQLYRSRLCPLASFLFCYYCCYEFFYNNNTLKKHHAAWVGAYLLPSSSLSRNKERKKLTFFLHVSLHLCFCLFYFFFCAFLAF